MFLGVWWIGAEVTFSGPADIALCTADRLDEADAAVGAGEIAASSLDAFGRGVADLPIGVTDYATAVRVQGDQIFPEPDPGPALAGRSVDQVLADARESAAAANLSATDRVWSAGSWTTPDCLLANLIAVFVAGSSLVQVTNVDPAAQARRRTIEKVTRELA